MSIFSRDLHEIDPGAVQWRLHVTPARRFRTAEARLFQVPGPVGQEASLHMVQAIDHWAFDLSTLARPRTVSDVLVEVCEATLQRRLPGLD